MRLYATYKCTKAYVSDLFTQAIKLANITRIDALEVQIALCCDAHQYFSFPVFVTC